MRNNISILLVNVELNKFANLCFSQQQTMPMFSELIDCQWHDNIHLGKGSELPFHDTNIRTSTPVAIRWVPLYESYYGKLSKLWFMDAEGNFLREKYHQYLTSGEVKSSFNCAANFLKRGKSQ